MIYIFSFGPFFKMGYASLGPYERKAMGFWHNKHPEALCHRLDQCTLLHLYTGSEAMEKVLKAALVPDCGEFFLAARLQEVVGFLALCLEPLPLPEDPQLEPFPPRKKPCCGGEHGGFERAEHAARSFATKGKEAPCSRCGRVVSIRTDTLKRHQKRPICKPA